MPLKYLMSLLQSKVLFVSKVVKWEDPYENFFLKQNFVLRNGKRVSREMIDLCFSGIFGQSWTKKKSSDAMWRIYSLIPNKSNCIKDLGDVAVRIKTLPQQIMDEIAPSLRGCSAEIREVEYKTEYEIKEWVKHLPTITQDNMANLILTSLFLKRDSFEHEDEVRLIIHVPSEKQFGEVLRIPITPIRIVSEFVMDPRLSNDLVTIIRNELIHLGVDKGKIRKSRLYDLYKTTLVVDAQS